MDDDNLVAQLDERLCATLDEYSHEDYLVMAAGSAQALRPALFTLHKNELKSIIKQQAYLAQRRVYLEALLKLA
jgi:hypothetical protein